MLKKLLLFSIIVMVLCGCRPINTKDETSSRQYRISSNSNMANALFIDEYDQNLELQILSDEELEEVFKTGDSDFLIMPFAKTVQLFKDSKKFQILTILSYQKYYLISSQERYSVGKVAAYDDSLLSGINTYLQQTDLKNYNFEYYDSFKDAFQAFTAGEQKAIVVSDPQYLVDENYNEIVDYEKIYKINSDYDGIPEYCLLVNTNLIANNSQQLVDFASKLKMLINANLENPADFIDKIMAYGLADFGIKNKEALESYFEYSNLCFEFAYNQIDNMNFLCELMGIKTDDALYVH